MALVLLFLFQQVVMRSSMHSALCFYQVAWALKIIFQNTVYRVFGLKIRLRYNREWAPTSLPYDYYHIVHCLCPSQITYSYVGSPVLWTSWDWIIMQERVSQKKLRRTLRTRTYRWSHPYSSRSASPHNTDFFTKAPRLKMCGAS